VQTIETERDESMDRQSREKQVYALLHRYVKAVDHGDLGAWVEFFADESSYVVTTHENEARGLPLAFVLDDSKNRISDREVYIKEVWAGHYNDYRQRHILSDASIDWAKDEAHLCVSFALYIAEPTRSGSQLLATGEYVDRVVFEDGAAKFRSKKVIVDSDVLPRYFVYPL
jgi:3-phenylpropionate/cinnamic acid dioxygenase small subunit